MAAWSLGAEKAFDMREWLFSNNFNFIPLFTWVRVLYAYLFEAVKTSGVISSYFPPDQGKRWESVLSPLLSFRIKGFNGCDLDCQAEQ